MQIVKEQYKVSGMSCKNCQAHVQKALSGIEGVLKAEVSLENKTADVEYDSNQISPNQIMQTVAEAGYKMAR